MSKPLVSVVIPTFNSSEYLVEAIQSALEQTYAPLEVIVVDDGSTDNTREELSNLIEEGKIRYHFQSNRGLAAARNTGIKLAKGKYVQFLDADDLLATTKVEKQVASLENEPVQAICGSDYRCFNGSNVSHLYDGDSFKGNFPLNSVGRYFEFHTVVHRWLFPTSIFGSVANFDEDMPAREDWLLVWKLAVSGTRFLYIDEPLALYRKHGDNMTEDVPRGVAGHLLALDHVESYLRQRQLPPYSKRELNALRESCHYELGLFYTRAGRSRSAWYHLVKALFLSPNRRQVKLLLIATLPALGANTVDWVASANERLWRWRAQLRKTLAG